MEAKGQENLFPNIILSCLPLLKVLSRGKIYPDFILRGMYYTCTLWNWTSLYPLSSKNPYIKENKPAIQKPIGSLRPKYSMSCTKRKSIKLISVTSEKGLFFFSFFLILHYTFCKLLDNAWKYSIGNCDEVLWKEH